MGRYIKLADDFVVKGSESEQVLASLRRHNKYFLNSQQFEFLKLCDGKRTEQDILLMYHPDDHLTVKEYLVLLQDIGAIEISQTCSSRSICAELVPDMRLQAVHFEITGGCNMRCAHCYQGDIHDFSSDLTLKEIESLIHQMRELQVEHVNIGGGEPLTRADFFEIVELVETNDMRVSSLFTNGLLVDEKIVERFLKCRSVFTVYLSLDAITGEGMRFRGFEPKSGKKALGKILSHIKAMMSQGIPVVINTLLNKHTIDNLHKMHDVVCDLNVSSWRLGFPKNVGSFIPNKKSFKESWQRASSACLDILRHHLDEGSLFHMQIEYLFRPDLFDNMRMLPEDDFVCDYEGRREGCCIRPNCDVVSCAYGGDFPIGNIRHDRLWDIWYSKAMKRIKNMRIGDVEGCKECPLKPVCATGCRLNAHFLAGDMNHSPDYDACMAVEFFLDKVVPLLTERGILSNRELLSNMTSLSKDKSHWPSAKVAQ